MWKDSGAPRRWGFTFLLTLNYPCLFPAQGHLLHTLTHHRLQAPCQRRKLAPVVTSLAVIVFFRDCPQTLAFLEGVCVLSWGSLTASSSPDSSCSACVTLLSQPPE